MLAVWSNRKMPRRFAAGGMRFYKREGPFGLVDVENREAVVAAVGDVEEFARGMNGDLGGRAIAIEIRRQGRKSLKFAQRAFVIIVREDGDRRSNLAVHVGELAIV